MTDVDEGEGRGGRRGRGLFWDNTASAVGIESLEPKAFKGP